MNSLLTPEEKNGIRSCALARGLGNVRVFGSFARGDATEQSDLDLLVRRPRDLSALVLGGFLADVEALTRRKVDVVSEQGLHPLLRDRILKEAIPL